ncbi:induced myeloid leukemia cell differentiation protein Mcl-1 [Pelodiscus sinensis]|uniref:induced myeloid leukemia cell differentiation protein Mcl-1 n=1 Tax=Pelodiscus sinensis TaxID=13735 RepID=UPI003F6D3CE3
MLALKRNAVIGLNLYCGGGPALVPSSPASPSGGAAPPPSAACPSGPSAEGDRPSPLIGRSPWGPNGPSEGARALMDEGPRALIGSPGTPPALVAGATRPASLWLPEEELDGCEPEAERLGPADGSLPSTPPEEADDADGLYHDSLELISRYLREAADPAGPGGAKLFKRLLSGPRGAGPAAMEKALDTLRKVGDGVMEKHQIAFQGMLRKLDIKNEEDLKSVSSVATHVFSDGITNWGRIVTLISFGAFVAKHLKSINQENCINTLAGIITDVLVSDKRDWLVNQRGWEGFVEFFRVEDLEGSIRNVLVAFAGFAGLGASLAYMMR